MLERLAPRIERAQFIAPEAHDAIMLLVERIQREVIGQPQDARRQAVIERVSQGAAGQGRSPHAHKRRPGRERNSPLDGLPGQRAGKYFASQSRMTPQTRALSSANRK